MLIDRRISSSIDSQKTKYGIFRNSQDTEISWTLSANSIDPSFGWHYLLIVTLITALKWIVMTQYLKHFFLNLGKAKILQRFLYTLLLLLNLTYLTWHFLIAWNLQLKLFSIKKYNSIRKIRNKISKNKKTIFKNRTKTARTRTTSKK